MKFNPIGLDLYLSSLNVSSLIESIISNNKNLICNCDRIFVYVLSMRSRIVYILSNNSAESRIREKTNDNNNSLVEVFLYYFLFIISFFHGWR